MSEENEKSTEAAQGQMSIGLDLGSASLDTIGLFLDESDDPQIFRDALEFNRQRPDVLKLVYEHPDTPDDVRADAAGLLSLPVMPSTEVAVIKQKKEEKKKAVPATQKKETLTTMVQKLKIGEKIVMAMRGGKEVRTLMLRESSKQVVMAALENPKLTITEVEATARSRNVSFEVLKKIASNREWMRNYGVLSNIVTNPKTPAGIAMQYVSQIKKKDLEQLSKSKAVSEVIRIAAKRLSKKH